MKVTMPIAPLVLSCAVTQAFIAPAPAGRAVSSRGRDLHMIFDFFGGNKGNAQSTTSASSSSGRLNLNSIKKEAPKNPPVKSTPTSSKSVGGARPKAGPQKNEPPAARMVNRKLQGFFSKEQVEALSKARKVVPSNAPQYWQKVAAMVPGQSAETCKAMAQQIAFDKSAGTKSNFFGDYVEVKEGKDYVDPDATPMNRLRQAFGLKK